MITLTVSIVTADNRDLILDCLRSIYETTNDLRFEVYVVINNSCDDSEVAIKENFPEVELIINRKKLGFTHNHNMVMRRGTGKYFLVLNDDTIILDNALKKMIDYMEASPGVGILGCKLLNPDGSFQWSYGDCISHKFEHFKTGVLHSFLPFVRSRDIKSTREVSWVTGACLMVRSRAIQDVGLFDENFIIYYEDGDLCWRMIKSGWKVVMYPHAEIIHYLGKTREKHLLRDLNIIYLRSRYYFFRKHYSFLTFLLVKLITVIELVLQNIRFLAVLTVRRKKNPRAREYLKAYSKILWRALGIQTGAGQ
jgi:GT2 family glycosyltransferase